MADATADHDALIQQFCNLTGTAPHEAEQYLATNQWDLPSAAAEYYTSQEEGVNDAQVEETAEAPAAAGRPSDIPSGPSVVPAGGRTLGDLSNTPQAIPTTSQASPPTKSSSRSKPTSTKKFATLGDLNQGQAGSHGHGGHGHAHDDDDDDDSDYDDRKQNMFAGGEKSGLAVKNPDPRDQVRKIIEKAKKAGPRPGGEEPTGRTSRFTGTARTLGGDDTPSEIIPDPNAATPQPAPTQQRVLHLWRDGFSVDDGALYRFDDPANAEHLRHINRGQAPLAIMNVRQDQPVDVTVNPHQENFVQPKKKYTPFGGGGQRLGSPTPGAEGISSQPFVTTGVASFTTPSSTSAAPATVDVNDSQPTVSLQVRLGDGTRLVSRFNTTHTIGDVYAFVNSSHPTSSTRPWVLMTTFPSKELDDKDVVLGDLPDLKRGGVVVQKWK
ncbi:MAG: hypothetical protein M1835_006875 [Candelina submexicana]|nr:MAG: hypothetical protein M1835_006875 [Candelina submexicana]